MLIELKKDKTVRGVITIIATIASALLQIFVTQTSTWPVNLLSGGLTGVAILIDRITSLYGYSFFTSLGTLALSIPVAFLRSKSISVWFTFYSTTQVFPASFFLKILHSQSMFNDVMLNVVFGGFLYGIRIVIVLRDNVSTNGTDFITLYVPNKTGRSIWEYVFAGNVLILCTSGFIFDWIYVRYSILFQCVSARTISAFYHRYEQVTFQTTTSKAEAVIRAYIVHYRHGIPCVDAVSGYSHKKMNLFHTVVSSYEMSDTVALMREEDSHVIMNMIKTENLYGGFYQVPMG